MRCSKFPLIFNASITNMWIAELEFISVYCIHIKPKNCETPDRGGSAVIDKMTDVSLESNILYLPWYQFFSRHVYFFMLTTERF